jgi:hypothetical protein
MSRNEAEEVVSFGFFLSEVLSGLLNKFATLG